MEFPPPMGGRACCAPRTATRRPSQRAISDEQRLVHRPPAHPPPPGRIRGGRRQCAISVQTMTKTDTRDVRATVNQIRELEAAGCDIVRLAVVDEAAAHALAEIRREVSLPLIADIHFQHKLALIAIDAGMDGLRINPAISAARTACARLSGPPRRAGSRSASGSMPVRWKKDLLENPRRRHGGGAGRKRVAPCASAGGCRSPVDQDFRQGFRCPPHRGILPPAVAYRRLSTASGCHRGGNPDQRHGPVERRLGHPAAEGIGDTLRVSLTAHPHRRSRWASNCCAASACASPVPASSHAPPAAASRLTSSGWQRG